MINACPQKTAYLTFIISAALLEDIFPLCKITFKKDNLLRKISSNFLSTYYPNI